MVKDGKIYTGPLFDRISPGPLGVRKYERPRCHNGYTLFSTALGNTEYLVDMNGMVVHTWPCTHSQLAELLPDGNLLVDNYSNWLEEKDPEGKTLWIWKEQPGIFGDEKTAMWYHHDFAMQPSGNIVSLRAKIEPTVAGFYAPELAPEEMQTDVVIETDRGNNVVWEFSFSDHIQELHDLAGLPRPVRYVRRSRDGSEKEGGVSDWAHCNTIEVLPETPLGIRDRRFRAGNLLFSFRALDIIGIIDREDESIVWAWGLGTLDGQHQPTMLADGNILIFDNGTYRGYSKVVEMNPETGAVVWEYEDRQGFFSPYRAGAQRLPNGNTLICESDAGRLVEVTAEKEIVWDYYSPFLGQGETTQGRHIYRATRYEYDYLEPVIAARRDSYMSLVHPDGSPMGSFREVLDFYRKGFGG